MKILSAVAPILCLLVVAPKSHCQTNPDKAPECPLTALDATVAFANQGDENVVAVNYRNISERDCVLNGGIGAMFDNWHEGHNIWAKECRNCDAAGNTQPVAPLLVAPGESGHFLLRWKNVADGSEPCQDSDGFNTNGIVVVAPSLLAHVCSVVDERAFLPGTFPSGAEDSGPGSPVAQGAPSIELTAPDRVLYAGDSFPFRAVVRDPKRQLALDDHSCPVVFIRTRDETGSTMFHQVSFFLGCKTVDSSSEGRSIEMELRAPGLGVLNVPGSTSVQFYLLTGPANASEVALASSNQLPMKIVDPATIPPAWGAEAAGIAVSLVLDKENYRTGDDIPLRITLENFRGAADIGSGELPCGVSLTIDVRDSSGTPVPVHGMGMLCTGHGWSTGYPAGKPVMIPGMSLRGLAKLPDRPGTYTVTATWNATSFVAGEGDGVVGRSLKPYAVAQSRPVTFRLVAERY
jgi:hypothetical protein